jgi:heme/copper-type cytochrome/quinol oxidase subunit 2
MNKPSISYRLLCAALLAALAIDGTAASALACPMCKEALAGGGGDLVSGVFYSILFMLSMPFLILGGITSYFYWLVRRARAERQMATSGASVQHRASVEETVGV